MHRYQCIKCGAKTRSGKPCTQWAVKGKKRCRMHGGNNDGAKKGNRSAVKTGLYQRVLTSEDQERFEDAKANLGTLDDEITLTRFRLEEVMRNKTAWDKAHPAYNGSAEAQEILEGEEGDPPVRISSGYLSESIEGMELENLQETDAGVNPGTTVRLRRPDFEGAANVLTNTIARLEDRRAIVMEAADMRRQLEEALAGSGDNEEDQDDGSGAEGTGQGPQGGTGNAGPDRSGD